MRAASSCALPASSLPVCVRVVGASCAGLERLVAREVLTAGEHSALLETGLSSDQYSWVLLEWIGLRLIEARERGVLRGGDGFEQQALAQIAALRGSLATIGDALDFRMNMAYVQFVQILIDTLVLLAPFALYPTVGVLSVPLAALVAYFYIGLLELSKSFFDIFGREGYEEQTINVQVLVQEVNFAAITRWQQAGRVAPVKPLPAARAV